MPNDRVVVREILWQEICPGLLLLRAVRIALSFRVLLLALAGLLAMIAGWRLIGSLFSATNDPVLQLELGSDGVWPWEAPLRWTTATAPLPKIAVDRAISAPWAGLDRVWTVLSAPLYSLLREPTSFHRFGYLVLAAGWSLVVWSLFGGAVVRIAALRLAREERLGALGGLWFSMGQWRTYCGAVLLPFLGIVLLAIPIALLGVVFRVDWLVWLAFLLMPLALAAGFLMAILAIGLAFGWPLMWPAVTIERPDSFDAVSRSYAYTFQRPLHYFLYVVAAGLLGLLALFVVNLFVATLLALLETSLGWGAGAGRAQELMRDYVAIRFWTSLVTSAAVAFPYGYFWVAATAIYLLLRRSTDSAEFSKLYVPQTGEPLTLPPLPTDAAGVPGAPPPETTDEV